MFDYQAIIIVVVSCITMTVLVSVFDYQAISIVDVSCITMMVLVSVLTTRLLVLLMFLVLQ